MPVLLRPVLQGVRRQRDKIAVARVCAAQLSPGQKLMDYGPIREGFHEATKAIMLTFEEGEVARVDAFLAGRPARLGSDVIAT